jgi:hypothetical protein
MVEVLKFIFEDFWHFIGCAVLLAIIAMWNPVEVNILNGFVERKQKDE